VRTFIIRPTKKTVKWLNYNKINLGALQSALSMLYADIMPQKHFTKTILTLQTDFSSDSSGYFFGTNKIYICEKPDLLAKTRKQQVFVIFLHFLHEFRHWMQSEILGIKDSQLKYTQKDLERNSKRYWNNKYEVDARKFERRYIRKFMRYYVSFKNAGR